MTPLRFDGAEKGLGMIARGRCDRLSALRERAEGRSACVSFEIIALARRIYARLKIVPARAAWQVRPILPAPLIEHFRTSAAAARRGAVGRTARGGPKFSRVRVSGLFQWHLICSTYCTYCTVSVCTRDQSWLGCRVHGSGLAWLARTASAEASGGVRSEEGAPGSNWG